MVFFYIIDTIRQLMFTSIGFIFGFCVGVIVGVTGLYKTYAALPNWISILLLLLFSTGVFFIINILGNKGIEKRRDMF